MSERWRRFIVDGVDRAGGPFPFALAQWAFLQPVFDAIRRAVPAGGRLLDVGCGAAIFSSLVAHHGYQVTGIDDDPDIVAYAARMVEWFRSPARVERASAVDLGAYHDRFDLVYSLGVVEHFDADVTVTLVREQLRCAPLVVVVVPTKHMHHAGPVTDERLHSRGELAALVGRAGARVRESFVFGDVPTALSRNAERMLPGALDRRVRRALGYGMDICCVGERV
jgi:SAM-dependent methyltransferase